MRIITKVLRPLLGTIARPFLDDIPVKGPRSTYNNEESMPGIRRYILEHIQNIDRTLLQLERAGFTISGEKMQLCMPAIDLVGFICDSDGRHPDLTKVSKILSWTICGDRRDIRAFLGLIGYFRAHISHHTILAGPLYELLRKDAPFIWGKKQQQALDDLKAALAMAAALITIQYEPNPDTGEIDEIVIIVDASIDGWGAGLLQIQEGKRRPVRFDSGLWSPI